MGSEALQQAVGVGSGIIFGSGLVLFITKQYIVKVDLLIKEVASLAASFDAWKIVPEQNRVEIKDHERRITLAEPKIARAHDRLDNIGMGRMTS